MAERSLTLLVAIGLASSGCISSPFMKPAQRAPIHGDAARATVVFVRPSSVASDTLVRILDERGTFLGDSLPGGYFIARVDPGEHVFVGWGANTTALGAQLAAGRTYYVEVVVRLGSLSSRANLFAIHTSRKDTESLGRAMRSSKPFAVDARAGQAFLRKHEHDTFDRIRQGREIFVRFTNQERNDRTLRVEDGRTE